MLTISPTAAEAIKRIAPEGGLKISATPDAETKPTLRLSVADGPGETDQVAEAEGSRVFVDQTAAPYVDGKVLEARREEDEIRFSLRDQGPPG